MRVVSVANFLTVGVFECDIIAHHRSVAVLCMLYKIRCSPIHPLYMPVRVTRGALVAHRYNYAPPRCRISQSRRHFFHSQCPSGTILLTLYLLACYWGVSRTRQMLFHWPKLLYPFFRFGNASLSLLSVYRLV